MLLLEFADLVGHSSLGEVEDIRQTLELRQSAQHACSIDDQLANHVHHAVKTVERDE